MSCIEQESVEIENSTREKEGKAQKAKLLAVPRGRVRRSDRVDSRVAEVFDLQLARGSMPT